MKITKKTISTIAIMFILIFFVFPFVWLIIQSFQTNKDLLSLPPSVIPTEDFLTNYRAIFFGELRGLYKYSVPTAIFYILRATLNSVIVATISSISILFMGSLAAYVLAFGRFRGSDKIAFSTILVRTLPTTAMIIPIFLVMHTLNLLDTYWGLIIVYLGTVMPYALWILISYFQTIPSDLIDAARIDGCSRFQCLSKVIIPLALPGLTTAFLFSFLLCWNEFFVALILTSSSESYTLPVVISMFTVNPQMTPYDLMITCGVLGALPPVTIALIFQKYIIKGLTAGAIKG